MCIKEQNVSLKNLTAWLAVLADVAVMTGCDCVVSLLTTDHGNSVLPPPPSRLSLQTRHRADTSPTAAVVTSHHSIRPLQIKKEKQDKFLIILLLSENLENVSKKFI